jgi:hypothetical protein
MMGINSKAYDEAFYKVDPSSLATLDAEQVLGKLQDSIVCMHPMYWIRRYVAGLEEDEALVPDGTDVSIGAFV